MIALQQMLVMNNGVLQRVLVPVQRGNAVGVNANRHTGTAMMNGFSRMGGNGSMNPAEMMKAGRSTAAASSSGRSIAGNPSLSHGNPMASKSFGQQTGASCPVCSMLFPLSITQAKLRTHISRCQEREIAYASHRVGARASNKRSYGDMESGNTSPRSTGSSSGLDLLLGAANKAAKVSVGASPSSDMVHCNLCGERTWSKKQICVNCTQRKKMTSSYRGVCANRGKWQVQINANGKRHYLGYFPSEILAAKAYDAAAIYFHGDKAKLNFDIESSRKARKPDLLLQIIATEHAEKMAKIKNVGFAATPDSQVSNFDLGIATAALIEASNLAAELDGTLSHEAVDDMPSNTSVTSSVTTTSVGDVEEALKVAEIPDETMIAV